MVVEVSDIRDILLGVTASMIPDRTISFWIDVATDIIESAISESITDAKKERAITLLAAYYTMHSYATYVQTSTGRVPNLIFTQLQELSKASAVLASIVSVAEGPMGPPFTLVSATSSKWDE